MDPNAGTWNLDPDPDPGLCNQFCKNGKNTKNSFGEKTIFFKKAFFKLTMIEENNGLGRKFLLVKSEW